MNRFLCALLIAVAVAVAVPASAATQGEFALALAQILGFDVSDQSQAAKALDGAEVAPIAGWQVVQQLTPEVIQQVERALGLAVDAGIVKSAVAAGAVEAAAAAVGTPFTSTSTGSGGAPTSIPSRPPIGGPQGSNEGQEGSPFRP